MVNNKPPLVVSDDKKNWVKATSEDLNFNIAKAIRASDKPITTREQLNDSIKLLAIHIKKYYDNQRVVQRTVYRYFEEIRAGARRLGLDVDTVRRIVEETYREYGVTDAQIRKVMPHEPRDKKSLSNIKYEEQQDRPELSFTSTSTPGTVVTNMQPNSVLVGEPSSGKYVLAEGAQDFTVPQQEEELPNDTAIQLSNALERIRQLERENRELKEQLANSVLIGQEVMVFNGFLPLDDKTHLPLTVAINFKEKKMEYADVNTDAIREAAENSYKTS